MSLVLDLREKVAVVTGGYGVLGGSIADALGSAGAKVVILGRNERSAAAKVDELRAHGVDAIAAIANVLDAGELHDAAEVIGQAFGRVDILVNAAGGNVARARTDGVPVFDMPFDGFDEVVRLNLHGSVYPSLVFGEMMAERRQGSIVNISSMASTRVLSGVLGYSVAKAAIDSFTRWMAVDLARRYGDGLRVNAIAPGFFVAAQNRHVLLNEDGTYTDRAKRIIANTPMGRFGDPSELQGPVLWLCSDAASFVTATVIPVDGGFSSDGGI